jgi:hypothetical protein
MKYSIIGQIVFHRVVCLRKHSSVTGFSLRQITAEDMLRVKHVC